jgi:uncharacterized protein (DUF2062 family)
MRALKRHLPTPQQIQANRFLRWMAPAFADGRLWAFKRRSVAVGLAIGLFFGLLIPVAQILFAVVAAVALRANVAVAAATTLVTNPFTFPPIYYVAYRLGGVILGEPAPVAGVESFEREISGLVEWAKHLLAQAAGVTKPLALGLGVMATVAAILGYWGVHLGWRVGVLIRRRRRTIARARIARDGESR